MTQCFVLSASHVSHLKKLRDRRWKGQNVEKCNQQLLQAYHAMKAAKQLSWVQQYLRCNGFCGIANGVCHQVGRLAALQPSK